MTKLAEALWKDDVDLEEALKLYVMSVRVFKDVRYFLNTHGVFDRWTEGFVTLAFSTRTKKLL